MVIAVVRLLCDDPSDSGSAPCCRVHYYDRFHLDGIGNILRWRAVSDGISFMFGRVVAKVWPSGIWIGECVGNFAKHLHVTNPHAIHPKSVVI